ncbi:hypothetical protein MLD38_039601 [Melastoma candidum]|uniref:Uncharacterized protein n=1 Tax=Melastoma candidum TaxID=119954 RepID=A0ACB9L318_9MYRT|nr:hypothetical protein MLD38_039601 [Melastoma candidum]
MISSVSWVPKGASRAVPEVAEPPSKEEIKELLKNGGFPSGDGGSDEDEEEMELDNTKKANEVSQALAVANALGRASKITNDKAGFDAIADGLRELNMDNYDEEDEDIELFSTGLGDLYYPSNEMDPYLKHDDEDDDSEELDNIATTPMDSLIVCARTEDEVNLLEEWINSWGSIIRRSDFFRYYR